MIKMKERQNKKMSNVRKNFPSLFVGSDKDFAVDIPAKDTIKSDNTTDTVTVKKESKLNKRVRDMFGNFIVPGSYIAYPGRQGSDTYMRTAKVLEVTERNLDGDRPETVLKIAVAMAPRYHERKNDPNWQTKIVKTTMSQYYRSAVVPQSYIQHDDRYKCLLEV